MQFIYGGTFTSRPNMASCKNQYGPKFLKKDYSRVSKKGRGFVFAAPCGITVNRYCTVFGIIAKLNRGGNLFLRERKL